MNVFLLVPWKLSIDFGTNFIFTTLCPPLRFVSTYRFAILCFPPQLLSWNKFWYCFVLLFVQASKLINFLGEWHDIYLILPMYNCFWGACAKLRGIVHANLCLDLMHSHVVGKNEVSDTELLKVCMGCWSPLVIMPKKAQL